MQSLIEELRQSILNPETMSTMLRVAAILAAGFIALNLIKVVIIRNIRRRASSQTVMLTRKVIMYSGGFVVLFIALREAGLNLNILLGTAGVAGIAIGFASQTSISNIISSLFLISEKPFEVDDVISVGGTSGIVMSIDLLSVKIRTFANTYIRIPNETIIKSEVTNITRFPIRRLDLEFRVSFEEDVEKVRDILKKVAASNPYCLNNPEPLFIFNGFGESAINLFFGVWFEKNSYISLKNSILLEIKSAFRDEGVAIPYPGMRIIDDLERADGFSQ